MVEGRQLSTSPSHFEKEVSLILSSSLCDQAALSAVRSGPQKEVDPEVFRVFYTLWKETEAEAQDVHLPAEVIEQLDNNECVYKLSCSVKTSYGVGKIAMTQKRLFLLTDGRRGFVDITKFRDIVVRPVESPVSPH